MDTQERDGLQNARGISSGANHRFEDFDRRFQTLEKRFDDVKWYLGGAAALFALFISLFSLISNSNLSSEKASLEQFKSELRAALGKAGSVPDLEILGVNGEPLSGQEVPARLDKDKDGNQQLYIRYILRNKGTAQSGQMFLKVYTDEPLDLTDFSTDKKAFKYETDLGPESSSPNDIPGGNYTTPFTLHVAVHNNVPPGKYPVLFKIYFGRGVVLRTQSMVSL